MSKKNIAIFGSVCLLSILMVSGIAAGAILTLPRIEQLADYQPPQVSKVFDRNGLLIAEFFTEKRTVVPMEQIPPQVKHAFLAAEDADFYRHNGIDYGGLTRAILTEIKHAFIGGRRVGGSTITQQAARTLLLSRERTYTRKLKEIMLARKIEESLSKDEILGLYLNQIYFGNGVYGIEEAARFYYGCHARNLTLGQAAALASVPKSPNRINPRADKNRIIERRAYVLRQMVVHGFITVEQEQRALKEAIVGKPYVEQYLNQAPFYAETIRRKLVDMLGSDAVLHSGLSIYAAIDIKLQIQAQKSVRAGLRQIDKRHGYRGPLLHLKAEDGQKLSSLLSEKKATLFSSNQNKMWDLRRLSQQYQAEGLIKAATSIPVIPFEKGVAAVVLVRKVDDVNHEVIVDLGPRTAKLPFSRMKWARRFNPAEATRTPYLPSDVVQNGDLIEVRVVEVGQNTIVQLEQTPLVEGALVAIEPDSHDVVAIVGGYDFNNSQFNRATQAKRQPGSTFKPFIYAAAIDKEIVTASTLITDAPKIYLDTNDSAWRPNNNTREYLGDITVRTCLLKSVNTCSISLLESLGVSPVLDLAKNVQINTDNTPFPRNLTIALGSADVVPIDFVNAFSIFPNLGSYAAPVIIKKVVAPNGEILFEATNPKTQVLRPQSAFVVSNILKGYITPSVKQHLGSVLPVLAGKTGTSNEWRNAWFVGFSPDLVAGVYVGFDDNRSLGRGEFGIRVAMPIWGQFMRGALENHPFEDFEQPPGIVWREVNKNTGLMVSAQATAQFFGDDFMEPRPRVISEANIMEAFIEGSEPSNAMREASTSSFGFFDAGPSVQ